LLFYYITDRTQLPGDEAARRGGLLAKIAEATRCGVDYIQLREKDLSARELEVLAREAVRTVRENQLRAEKREQRTAFLINSRTDIALAAGADGVHLRSDDVSPSEVRKIWNECDAGAPSAPLRAGPNPRIVGVSCHSASEVARAAADGADFVVLAPVFGKKADPDSRPAGLDALRRACRERIPVLALGGITLENAPACLQAGAAGVAGIRLFQENDIHKVIEALRSLSPHPRRERFRPEPDVVD
jgi:thiamine-phosphate pyrophosphorylase